MSEKSFTLDFEGYWREARMLELPTYSGIFCIYKCRYNETAGTVAMRRLLFIGEADNIRSWLQDHPMWIIWHQFLKADEQICISTAEVTPTFRKRVLAACIRKHEPPANSEYRNEFPFDRTRILNKGKHTFLNDVFVVDKALLAH